MPPNNADKRKAVTILLTDAEWSAWSDREIVRQCHVGNKLVGDVRRSLCSEHIEESTHRTYTTKHGTEATMKIGGPSAGGKESPEETCRAAADWPKQGSYRGCGSAAARKMQRRHGGGMTEHVHARLVSAMAEQVSARATQEAITFLQQQPACLSGDDSGLGNVWLEFCVQVQGEHSYDWDAFELHVRQVVEGVVFCLAPLERDAVWLQTPAAEDWLEEPDIDANQVPANAEDVIDSLYGLVCRRAADWEDDRIERYLYPEEDADMCEEEEDDDDDSEFERDEK